MIERSRVRVPAGAAGEFSSPGSTFCADSHLGIRSTPRVTAVARKRSRSLCQNCRWQVTRMHPNYVDLNQVMWHGAWLYSVHRTRREGSRFTRHGTSRVTIKQRCKHTISVDI